MFLPALILLVVAVVAAVVIGVTALVKALKDSRKDADKNFPEKPVGCTTEPCPLKNKEKPKIVRIVWLDGSKELEVATATQWVNLPKVAKWVDVPNDVQNLDRLSQKIRYKVVFDKPGGHSFKVKPEAALDNVTMTGGEKGRNSNFKWMDQQKSYTTDGDGTKVIETDFYSTCAGLDHFKLIAEDTYGTPPVETGYVKTMRMVYIVVVKMTGMTTNTTMAALTAELGTHGIKLVELPEVSIARIGNIDKPDEAGYEQKCKTAFVGSQGNAKLPYAVCVGFTEHLAAKNPGQVMELTGVIVGPGAAAVEIPIMATGLTSGDGMDSRSLWNDLVPGEGWFVSATFTPDGGGPAEDLDATHCTSLPAGASNSKTVSVAVDHLAAGMGTIHLTVDVVDRMRAGLSFGANRICICTKAWWEGMPLNEQDSVSIHEMGHKIGMVADGTGKLPDKVETHYTAKGHRGPHCYFDLGVLATYSGVEGPSCVMFGEIGTNPPLAFCEKCAPAVRKMDLSTGWTT